MPVLDLASTDVWPDGTHRDYTLLQYVNCTPMPELQIVYVIKGWDIYGITYNRSSDYIPEHTEIGFIEHIPWN